MRRIPPLLCIPVLPMLVSCSDDPDLGPPAHLQVMFEIEKQRCDGDARCLTLVEELVACTTRHVDQELPELS